MGAQDPEKIIRISAEGVGSVAAREINGPVHVGDIVLQVESQISPYAVTAPKGTTNLPQPRSGLFIGREVELRNLRSAVESYDNAVVAQAMHGLGGVGKTALALQYAHTYRSNYTVVWWISADSAESVTAGLAALGFRLSPRLGIAGATSTESSEWAIAWLQSHSEWLLILDNVEDPRLASSLIGQTQNGHHLITSRVAIGWNFVRTQIGLDVLSGNDSVELLTRMSAISGEEEEKRAISLELGFLPLALEHAAAYVQCNKVSFERYLDLLRKVPEKALSYTAGIGTNSVSVTKTWQVTLQSIEERSPLAISILRILAWLGSDDIPREVLYGFVEDDFDVDGALGLLSAYSMISLTPDSVSIHRLVQAVIRASEAVPVTSASHPQVRAAIGIYNNLDLDPEISPDSWPLWRRLIPHIEALSHSISTGVKSGPTHAAMFYAARFLKSQNQLRPALEFAERCVQMADEDADEESIGPDVLSCMNILGAALQELGHHDRSVSIFQELVRDSVDKHGPLYPFTLSMKNNLASAYQDAGRLPEAIEIFEQTLEEREEVLLAEDPAIMTSRHNLAIAYRLIGKPQLSVPILERVVQDRAAKYGESGVGTLNSMFNLAISYMESGNLARAARMLKVVLSGRKKIFGPDDRNVVGARRKLADVYRKAGNGKRAIPIYEENMQSVIRAYGADDWRVAEHGMPLAFAYQDVKEPWKAIPLLLRVLKWQESACESSDDSVIMARNNLAVAYWLNGESGVASDILERAITASVEALGFDHKITRAVEVNLQNVKSGAPVRSAGQFDIGSLRFPERNQVRSVERFDL
ncbi:FxSxx-COOH system tetratricopeptide repeat protein [Streptomyces sp. NPDC051665]|uniref:FxSxx-COOH system tetratricopeptide repeat protein n=1 Tax=Streptomyces sp. NPDC051665 TaxID=3154647 RepID=UPI0034295C89